LICKEICCFYVTTIHNFALQFRIFHPLFSESCLMFPSDTRFNLGYTELGYSGTSVLTDFCFYSLIISLCCDAITRSVTPVFHISENTIILVYKNQSVKVEQAKNRCLYRVSYKKKYLLLVDRGRFYMLNLVVQNSTTSL
jgi:hypothetical protein